MKQLNDHVQEALQVAITATDADGLVAIAAFLDHLEAHYVGDIYVESSVSYLRESVREVRELTGK